MLRARFAPWRRRSSERPGFKCRRGLTPSAFWWSFSPAVSPPGRLAREESACPRARQAYRPRRAAA
eukprot:13138893-Heterocapsa_arctica.AAC.1